MVAGPFDNALTGATIRRTQLPAWIRALLPDYIEDGVTSWWYFSTFEDGTRLAVKLAGSAMFGKILGPLFEEAVFANADSWSMTQEDWLI